MGERYPTSKLLEVFTVQALTRQIMTGPHASERVILNMVNPGLCHSSLSRNTTGFVGVFLWLLKALLARTTETGSRTLVLAASGGPETNGQYLSDGTIKQTSEFVRSEEGEETQERVYRELMAIQEKIQPGITKNV